MIGMSAKDFTITSVTAPDTETPTNTSAPYTATDKQRPSHLNASADFHSIMPSVPVAGMALILGVDRFMSECRSITNVIGNAVATVLVTRWERALATEQFDAALAGQLPSVDRIDPAEIAA